MQQVNSLPITASQDSEFNAKNSHKPSRESSSDFSALVDKHLDSKGNEGRDNKTFNDEEKFSSLDNKGHVIAVDGKDNRVADSKVSSEQSNESDVQSSKGQADVNDTDKTSLQDKNTKDTIIKDKIEPADSLTESEQFISLLYHSDNALVEQEPEVSKRIEGKQENSNSGNKILNSEFSLLNADGSKAVNRAGNDNGEHKLKTFISEENSVKPSDVLTRYQQSLITKQATMNNESAISSLNIDAQKLNESDLALSHKSTDASLINTESLKGKLLDEGFVSSEKAIATNAKTLKVPFSSSEVKAKDTLVMQSTVLSDIESEGTIDSDALINEKVLTAADLNHVSNVIKNSEKGELNHSKSKATDKNINNAQDKFISQLDSSGEDSIVKNNNSEQLNHIISPEIKSQVSPSQANDLAKTIVSNQNDNNTKPSSVDLVKEQSRIDAEKSASISRNDNEQELAESDFSLANKSADITVKSETSKASVLTQPSPLSDMHNQAAQVKQDNSAYDAHESAAKVDQINTSEIVQTQKNNVQLHQETISIFKKDFAEAVKDKVMLVISQKLQQFDITLDPPEFGNMQVRVNLQGEQAAVNFVVQNQSAKDALEQNMHKLKEMLAEQGVDVGGADVQQQSQQQAEGNEHSSQETGSSNLSQDNTDDRSEHILSAELLKSSASGVDYYV
jgi:flagellar hook-length control protein FliK